MRPEIIIENTLRPEQFAAAATTAAVTSKGGNILPYVLLGLLALALFYAMSQYAENARQENYHQ